MTTYFEIQEVRAVDPALCSFKTPGALDPKFFLKLVKKAAST